MGQGRMNGGVGQGRMNEGVGQGRMNGGGAGRSRADPRVDKSSRPGVEGGGQPALPLCHG